MESQILRLHSLLSEAFGAATSKYSEVQAALAAARAELKAAQAAADLAKSRLMLQTVRNLERDAARAENRAACARGDLIRFENKYGLNKRPTRRRYRIH
ncbi:hypothetical protein [uncultured Ferrovibrio sp.]|jgi:multidrug resistance efflux pump|uniref:hypothetical protein n=1 Tax=uncultured Ferrovibrio sp. TaxID=1576913 RepID=UPI0026200294|nr:hypothetical protein [uncultured Ferrovibrio sp.]